MGKEQGGGKQENNDKVVPTVEAGKKYNSIEVEQRNEESQRQEKGYYLLFIILFYSSKYCTFYRSMKKTRTEPRLSFTSGPCNFFEENSCLEGSLSGFILWARLCFLS